MSVLADWQIIERIEHENMISNAVIVPKSGGISCGVSSYGYDVRLDKNFKVFSNTHVGIVDPKNFNKKNYVDIVNLEYIIIPPNGFALGTSIERLKIPRNILVICLGKSTYARCGIIVNVTPLEPEWEGCITVEISNTTTLPAKVYVGEGITQLIFIKADKICDRSYADKGGKYQHQDELTLPKVD